MRLSLDPASDAVRLLRSAPSVPFGASALEPLSDARPPALAGAPVLACTSVARKSSEVLEPLPTLEPLVPETFEPFAERSTDSPSDT